jgi:hypothetical protein
MLESELDIIYMIENTSAWIDLIEKAAREDHIIMLTYLRNQYMKRKENEH